MKSRQPLLVHRFIFEVTLYIYGKEVSWNDQPVQSNTLAHTHKFASSFSARNLVVKNVRVQTRACRGCAFLCVRCRPSSLYVMNLASSAFYKNLWIQFNRTSYKSAHPANFLLKAEGFLVDLASKICSLYWLLQCLSSKATYLPKGKVYILANEWECYVQSQFIDLIDYFFYKMLIKLELPRNTCTLIFLCNASGHYRDPGAKHTYCE